MRNDLGLLENVRFNGSDYKPEQDDVRLKKQINRVYALMIDGKWRTLSEIAVLTGDPESSVSAQLRHLRKPRFGSFVVNKQSRGEREQGLFEYQLLKGDHSYFNGNNAPQVTPIKASSKNYYTILHDIVREYNKMSDAGLLLEHEIIEKLSVVLKNKVVSKRERRGVC